MMGGCGTLQTSMPNEPDSAFSTPPTFQDQTPLATPPRGPSGPVSAQGHGWIMSGRMAFDTSGDLYIIMGTAVWKIAPSGTTSTIAGQTEPGEPIPGRASLSPLGYADGVAVDQSGNLYISDSDVVEKVTPDGTLSLFVDASQSLENIQGIDTDTAGNLYITPDNRVVRIAPDGTQDTMVGGGATGTPIPGPVQSSPLNAISDVLVAPDGSFFLSVFGNQQWSSNGYTGNSGGGWIVHVDTTGDLSIVAGNGLYGIPAPGLAPSSPFGQPGQLAMDDAGDLYIADALSSVVVKVTPGGQLSIIAGSGTQGHPIDGPATQSPLGNPEGLAMDGAGNLYISDNAFGTLVRVTPDGMLNSVFTG